MTSENCDFVILILLPQEDIESNGLPKGTEVVINVAGRNILEPFAKWNDMYKYDVLQSRVETSKTLAKAVESANPKIFATISGVAYYEPNSQEYTEQSTCQPYDFFSSTYIYIIHTSFIGMNYVYYQQLLYHVKTN